MNLAHIRYIEGSHGACAAVGIDIQIAVYIVCSLYAVGFYCAVTVNKIFNVFIAGGLFGVVITCYINRLGLNILTSAGTSVGHIAAYEQIRSIYT